jgi:hypothetical protein
MVDIVELRNTARRLRQWAKEIRLDSLPAPYATSDEDAGVLEKAAGEPAETRANQLESSNVGPIAALDTHRLYGYRGCHNLAARWTRASKQLPEQTYRQP